MRDVFVIGVDTLRFGKYIDKSIKDLAAMTATGCLKDAGLTKEAIQAVWLTSAWLNGPVTLPKYMALPFAASFTVKFEHLLIIVAFFCAAER